ncbi:hypothetical protein EVAR_65612_1 [Eumeta japonica]|uniref:Uncharacterized protein n=1 Tax=Eumeta variegata TaxID=151549 RepID=A0A4C1ZG76_EUMVA|nr:hypothetical protein EVAR_65612_1 [Eumeta japonica]
MIRINSMTEIGIKNSTAIDIETRVRTEINVKNLLKSVLREHLRPEKRNDAKVQFNLTYNLGGFVTSQSVVFRLYIEMRRRVPRGRLSVDFSALHPPSTTPGVV